MMRIPRIFYQGALSEGDTVTLDERASHYIQHVLRMREGSTFILFNGEGGEFHVKLESTRKNAAVVLVGAFVETHNESPLQIHLGQSISRGERMDYAIQKSVELGVTEITPLFTDRGNVVLKGERLLKRQQHWQAIAISACEQSGRCYIPQIHLPVTLDVWLKESKGLKLVCALPEAKNSHVSSWQVERSNEGKVASRDTVREDCFLLIGPEGGLTNEEIQCAKKYRFQGLSLGPRVLRTETATVVALTLLQSWAGDFSCF